MLFLATIICIVSSLPASLNLPLVDPGLFVISDVKTCGDRSGYCLLGSDCTMDDDFLPDPSGNCDSLRRAFTPTAPFVCCMSNKRSLQIRASVEDSATKKPTETKPKLSRNIRENIDPLKMNNEQLEKLNQIGLVVKNIVEQLLRETANTIRTDETFIQNETAVEENTTRNEIIENTQLLNDSTELKATTMNSLMETEGIGSDNVNFKTEIPLEIKEGPDTGKSDAIAESDTIDESDTIFKSDIISESDLIDEIESDISTTDDEFRAEKNICQKSCRSEIIYMEEKKPICYGTLLDNLWILTSATCATRLNKVGIRNVTVSRRDILEPTLRISNILVHENFKSPESKNSPENNDLALTSLTFPLQSQECVPCFIQKRNITNEVCKTFQNTNYKNSIKTIENCEGRVQLRNLIINSYLILPCNRWRMQYNQEGRFGSGLWCDGKLAGVQTGVGVGSLIYTSVNEHAKWISDNKRIEERR